jgi:putative hemolysin
VTDIRIWLILLALLGSAFFSGTETALISVNRVKLQSWLEKKNHLGRLVDKFLNRPSDILSTLLVGNNLMNVIATVLIADLIIKLFPSRQALSILVTALVIPAIVTPPTLFFGEIIPKTVAREYAGRFVPLLTTPLLVSHFLLTPVAKIANFFSYQLLRLIGIRKQERERIFTRKNIQRVLIESERSGILDDEERSYISGVFNFSESSVREVMTPRTEIVAVPKGSSIEEIAAKMNQSNFSRIPVYEESLDHIIGIVHVADFLGGSKKGGELLIHPVIFSPETRKCDSLFYEMRHKKCHLAVVLDEYGGTAGIVTLENLLEELVGDIHDVHDDTGTLARIARDNSFIVDGRTRLDELADKIDLPEKSYEVETIGGLLVSQLGRIPEEGERFQMGSLRITVLEATSKRVESLRLRQMDRPEDDRDQEGGEIQTIGEEDE